MAHYGAHLTCSKTKSFFPQRVMLHDKWVVGYSLARKKIICKISQDEPRMSNGQQYLVKRKTRWPQRLIVSCFSTGAWTYLPWKIWNLFDILYPIIRYSRCDNIVKVVRRRSSGPCVYPPPLFLYKPMYFADF